MTDTLVKNNSACGLRVTDSGVVSIGNAFADNFTGHLALDCYPMTHMNCVWTSNNDCDLYARNGKAVKLVGNTFDGALTDSCQFVGGEPYVYVE